jgi:nudix-type nucleoside diphosphatase (YffH/AdpP family)
VSGASSFEHLVFDWNGTLLDDVGLAASRVHALTIRHLGAATDVARYRALFRFPIREFYRALGFDFAATPFERLVDEYLASFDREVLSCRLHDGARAVLDAALEHGLGVSILSASQEETLRDSVRHFGLDAALKHCVGLRDSHAAGKLERAAELQEMLGCDPARVLLVGDTSHDAEIARVLGWSCRLVAHGHQQPATLRATGFPVVERLGDLPIRGVRASAPEGTTLEDAVKESSLPTAERVRVHEVKVLSDDWYVLKKTVFDFQRADGTWQRLSRETYDRGNGSVILPYDPVRGTVLLTRQFRYPAFVNGHDGMLIEACAGLLDERDPETCIKQEVEEETGLRLRHVKKVFEAFMSPGSVTERLFFFLAEYSPDDRTSGGGGVASEGEEIETLEPTLDEALAMVDAGTIMDGKTIMLLQYLKRKGGA